MNNKIRGFSGHIAVTDLEVDLDVEHIEKRMEFRVEQLLGLAEAGELTDWEENFVNSMSIRLARGTLGTLTQKQQRVILKVYNEYLVKGLVTIPEGGI